jgi:4-aminobutyrate aminotransferase-like enzyme
MNVEMDSYIGADFVAKSIARHAKRQQRAIQLAMVTPVSVSTAEQILDLVPEHLAETVIRAACASGVDAVWYAYTLVNDTREINAHRD